MSDQVTGPIGEGRRLCTEFGNRSGAGKILIGPFRVVVEAIGMQMPIYSGATPFGERGEG